MKLTFYPVVGLDPYSERSKNRQGLALLGWFICSTPKNSPGRNLPFLPSQVVRVAARDQNPSIIDQTCNDTKQPRLVSCPSPLFILNLLPFFITLFLCSFGQVHSHDLPYCQALIKLFWLIGFLPCTSQFLNQSMSSEQSNRDSLPMSSPVDSKPVINHALRAQKENEMWVTPSLMCFTVLSRRVFGKRGFTSSCLAPSGSELQTSVVASWTPHLALPYLSSQAWPCRRPSMDSSYW